MVRAMESWSSGRAPDRNRSMASKNRRGKEKQRTSKLEYGRRPADSAVPKPSEQHRSLALREDDDGKRGRAPKHDAGSAGEHQRTASAFAESEFSGTSMETSRRSDRSGAGRRAETEDSPAIAPVALLGAGGGLGLDRSARGQARTPARIARGRERGSPTRGAAERCVVRRRHGARE